MLISEVLIRSYFFFKLLKLYLFSSASKDQWTGLSLTDAGESHNLIFADHDLLD